MCIRDGGGDAKLADKAGETALMRAAARGHGDVLEALLPVSGAIDTQSANGNTALILAAGAGKAAAVKFKLTNYVPWFIIGFAVLTVLRSTGILPQAVADPVREVSRLLTILAMAALGLGVDIGQVRKVGRPGALAVVASLAVMISLSAVLIKLLGIGL